MLPDGDSSSPELQEVTNVTTGSLRIAVDYGDGLASQSAVVIGTEQTTKTASIRPNLGRGKAEPVVEGGFRLVCFASMSGGHNSDAAIQPYRWLLGDAAATTPSQLVDVSA